MNRQKKSSRGFLSLFYPFYSVLISPAETSCKGGWFGDQCQYQCHCSGCDTCLDGSCNGRECHSDWFGPACQYCKTLNRHHDYNGRVKYPDIRTAFLFRLFLCFRFYSSYLIMSCLFHNDLLELFR